MKLKDTPTLRILAKELGVGRFRDAEKAIREFCVKEVERIIEPFGKIYDLNKFLEIVSSSLGIKYEEVNADHEIQKISKKYLAKREIIFAALDRHLDSETDAVLFRLINAEPWETKYVAVIDCRGHKKRKAYFSKWHEVGHVLIMSPQESFQFRRTLTHKRDPKEQIVDKIAGDLAFYSPLFLPELLARIKGKDGMTFEVVEELREAVCPEASREATIRGAVPRNPLPQLFVIADYGMKKNEQKIMSSQQLRLFPDEEIKFEPKLRAVQVIVNNAASKAGLRIHANMEVPQESVITKAYEETSLTKKVYSNLENLNWWKHSRGQLDDMAIWVEAKKSGNRVFALISQRK
ncbi:MAG: hypothetical protein JXA79_12335 [Deltaproteobacteria bacterium]|nr:hypothetical protein [Deltaproteobacteria bacterium]